MAGSPRREGNTDLLLQEAIRGATEKGAETKFLILSELNITPCRGGYSCLKDGNCVILDDMSWIYNELREADGVILASPIFFMGVTAQTKAMIDRCQSLWVLKYLLHHPVAFTPGKKRLGIFLSTGASEDPHLFEGALKTVKSWFATLDISYSQSLLLSGISEKGEVLKHPTALQEAFMLGQKLASEYSWEA